MTTIAHRPHEEHRSPPAPVAQPLTPDAGLSALAALACTLCQTPMALISRVTPQHQQLVAQVGLGLGLGLGESSAALPHLAWTIATPEPPRPARGVRRVGRPTWQDDWLASGPAGIRFYAGLALHGPDGQPIGTLCVMDTQPRELDAATQAQFSALGQVLGPALAPSLPEAPSLRRRRERTGVYRTLVESQTDLISLATPEGRLTFVNPAFAAHAGRPAEALIGTSLYEHLPAADRDSGRPRRWPPCVPTALVLGTRCATPPDEARRAGPAWTHHPERTDRDGCGPCNRWTRHHRAQAHRALARKEAQARLRSLYAVKRRPCCTRSMHRAACSRSVTPGWPRSGYTRSEVIGRNSADFLTPESHDYARNVVLPRYLRDGRCDLIDYQMVRKDGTLIDVLLSATMERDAQGHPLRSLAILEDVTEKHAVEAALRANQERLSLATQANGIGIWELDLVARRLTWSEVMFQIFG